MLFTACGGVITDSAGRIESPGYPGPVIENIICEWSLSAGFGSVYHVQLHPANPEVIFFCFFVWKIVGLFFFMQ